MFGGLEDEKITSFSLAGNSLCFLSLFKNMCYVLICSNKYSDFPKDEFEFPIQQMIWDFALPN